MRQVPPQAVSPQTPGAGTQRWVPRQGFLQVRRAEAAPASRGADPRLRLGTATSRTSSLCKGGPAGRQCPFPSLLGKGCPHFLV